MTLHFRAALLITAATLLTLGTGCPSIPDLVSGGSTGSGSGTAPGETIDWISSQVDPTGEDTAGFNHVISADMNQDGLVDLVTAAYESQPIQIHLQQRSTDGAISFRSFSIAGSGPIVRVSELKVADFDQDGNLDIVLSIMDNGFTPLADCAITQGSLVILFAPPDPSDALGWVESNLTRTYACVVITELIEGTEVQRAGSPVSVEGLDGNDFNYSSVDVGDVNDDGFPDIVAAYNGCDDDDIPTKEVQIWYNPADETIRSDGEQIVGTSHLEDTDGDGKDDTCVVDTAGGWPRIVQQLDFPNFKSVRFDDVDLDEDLDVIALRPTAKTFDLTWQENPLIPQGSAEIEWDTFKTLHPIGESDNGLDLIESADLDNDGLDDFLAVGKVDRILRWFRHPKNAAAQDFPWDVYNIIQYSNLTPTAIDIADIDDNGQNDIVAAADGHIRWFTPLQESPYEPWSEQLVVDDNLIPDGASAGGETPFAPINSVHFVDIDDDGRMDIAATLDRSGVDLDAVIWLQNQEIGDE